MLEPVAARPSAVDRRVEKYVPTMATLGMNDIPAPIPTHRPWAKISCQYFVQIEVTVGLAFSLVVNGWQRLTHHAEHLQKDTQGDIRVKIPSIKSASTQNSNHQHQKRLQRSNPRNRRLRRVPQQTGTIFRLECAKSVQETPSVEVQEKGPEDLEPCFRASIGWWRGSCGLWWFFCYYLCLDMAVEVGCVGLHVFSEHGRHGRRLGGCHWEMVCDRTKVEIDSTEEQSDGDVNEDV